MKSPLPDSYSLMWTRPVLIFSIPSTGKFIISSGQYTTENYGPGFRFICENCSKKKGPHLYPSRKFHLELSTLNHKWTILLGNIPRWWFHFAFTWNRERGLKFYKNGQLDVNSSKRETIVDGNGRANDAITIGKPNKLLDMLKENSVGDLSIAHLAIWTYELSRFDVEVAFLTALSKTKNSIRCCQDMKGKLVRIIKFLLSQIVVTCTTS